MPALRPQLRVSFVLALAALGAARAEEAGLDLGASPSDEQLAELVWTRSPELSDARARLGLAKADVVRSALYPNPSLDVGVGGLPAGETNPPGLSVNQVVNVGVTVSEQVELFKRGPRQRAALESQTGVRFEAREVVRQRVLDLKLKLADVASTEVRIAALTDTASGAARLTALQEARAGKGDSAGLDTDRSRLEEQKLQAQLAEAFEHLEEALRECGHAAGVRCSPFGSPQKAQAFLEAVDAPRPVPPAEQRDDLLALEAQRRAALEQATLAEAHAVPDPTFRAGYLKDQFVISGNNPSTVFVGVTVPLPLFDHGQADAQAARVNAETATRLREKLLSQRERGRVRLEAQLRRAQEREKQIEERALPLARKVVENLEKALLVGSPLQDVILARRTLSELLADNADVDLAVFRTSIELDRLLGREPPMPRDLSL